MGEKAVSKTKHIKYDAVKYTLEDPSRMLIHVCNNRGVMGSGIAAQVKQSFKKVYDNYRVHCTLGDVSYSDCGQVANMAAQKDYYGYMRNFKKQKYLQYGALVECLQKLTQDEELKEIGITTIVVPYLMGADRAGGDWNVVLELVEFYLGELFEIVVCEL